MPQRELVSMYNALERGTAFRGEQSSVATDRWPSPYPACFGIQAGVQRDRMTALTEATALLAKAKVQSKAEPYSVCVGPPRSALNQLA